MNILEALQGDEDKNWEGLRKVLAPKYATEIAKLESTFHETFEYERVVLSWKSLITEVFDLPEEYWKTFKKWSYPHFLRIFYSQEVPNFDFDDISGEEGKYTLMFEPIGVLGARFATHIAMQDDPDAERFDSYNFGRVFKPLELESMDTDHESSCLYYYFMNKNTAEEFISNLNNYLHTQWLQMKNKDFQG